MVSACCPSLSTPCPSRGKTTFIFGLAPPRPRRRPFLTEYRLSLAILFFLSAATKLKMGRTTTVTHADARATKTDAYKVNVRDDAGVPHDDAVYSNTNGSGVYGGGLPAGTNAAKIANPGGSADVRPAHIKIDALTTCAADTTAPSMMIGSQFAADKTLPSGVRSDGAIGNTTIFLEANLPAAHTAVDSAEELQPIDLQRQGAVARSEPPPPLTWILLFFCALRAAAALLAGLYTLAAPNDTVRARMLSLPLSRRRPAHERPAADRLVLTRVRAVRVCAVRRASPREDGFLSAAAREKRADRCRRPSPKASRSSCCLAASRRPPARTTSLPTKPPCRRRRAPGAPARRRRRRRTGR